MSASSIEDLVADCLAALGARRTFGRPIAGLPHVPVAEPVLAALLADADGRLGPGPGVAWQDDGVLRVSSRPGSVVDRLVVDDAAQLPGVLAAWSVDEVHATLEVVVDVDLAAPAPPDAIPVEFDTTPPLYSLSPSLAGVDLVAIAGPGVVRQGQVDALQSFAAQAGCGVLNTWGAKGVFPWDSPYHVGTGGMQARDLELAGVLDADIVVAVGVDRDELDLGTWELGQVLEVEPTQLAALAFTWPLPTHEPERSRLYHELSTALAPLYESDAVPFTPARAARELAATRPAGALLAADPGPAGLWVARAFPTTEPGSVVVPATVADGFAAAAAVVRHLDGRPAVAVTSGPVDATTTEVLDLGTALGVEPAVLVWGDAPSSGVAASTVDDLVTLLGEAWAGERGGVQPVPVDLAATALLVEVAGPIVAWGGEASLAN